MKKNLLSTIAILACALATTQAQIAVGLTGTGTLDFSTQPTTTASGWSTLSVGASDVNAITSDAGMDTAVAALTASQVNQALGSSTTYPPSKNAIARWNNNATSGFFLQSRPTGNNYTALMCTLSNVTGSSVAAVDIAYDYGVLVPSGSTINESIQGFRVYWSLTGAAGSWTVIPEFSDIATAGHLTASLAVGSWAPDSLLYILWADDNGPSTDAAPTEEGAYTIDNFSVTPATGGALNAVITPGDTNVLQCSTVTFRAFASGGTPPYTYQWYLNDTGTPLANGDSNVFVLHNVQTTDAGSYFVIVQDSTSGGSQMAPSTPCNLGVTPDTTPVALVSAISATNLHTVTVTFSKKIAISSATGGDFLARPVTGSGDISFTSAVVTNGNTVVLTTADPLQRKNYNLMVQGTGVRDECQNTSLPDGTSVRLVQNIVLLGMSDDTSWKYREDGVDPGADWMSTTLVDSSWLQGLAVFDAKRGSNRVYITTSGVQVPVRTQLNLTNANYQNFTSNIPSFYFRTHFSFPGEVAQSSLHARTFYDDSGVIFLNGQETHRIRVTNDLSGLLSFDLYCPAAPAGDAGFEGPFTLTNVVHGQNLIAVMVKQQNYNSSDITFGLELTATITNFVAVVEGPRMTVVNHGNGTATISWNPAIGTLQEATDLGTWADSANQGNGTPRAISGRKFYRVR